MAKNQNYGYNQPAYNPYGQGGQYYGADVNPLYTTPSGGPIPGYQPQQYPAGNVNPAKNVPGMLPLEESYIENILRLNKGKVVTVYATFENNTEWNAKVFKGVIEAAGRDHLILSDPQTGMRYLIPMIYLDYATFAEEIEYEYPYGGAPTVQYPPR